MMQKELFYGTEQEKAEPGKRDSKRKQQKGRDPKVILTRDPMEQLESESSLSNPRNIGSND